MVLRILSLDECAKYVSMDNTYWIRIVNNIEYLRIPQITGNNCVERIYRFDDVWPDDWNEYDWVDINDAYFNGMLKVTWEEMKRLYPEKTKKDLLGLMESEGTTWERRSLLSEAQAGMIMDDYEEAGGYFDNVIIHCNQGLNRSPAVGKAMNEIYGWGIEGLEDEFPFYRRYVYEIMMRAASDRFK